ncbi:16S rRNA (cytosine(967)-C(5))-methyltransferase RsmB [Salinicola endophyticus]|uniref:16S rRNA (cytosine(967)-C(5))-methyltransferase n=1 Tax=Salinicola endophyticus TaxID=1949083 RepID=A0ABY8FI08_9GAMM|nr:16S rRNA (cytosine(967)-C(5))-methyltransferase RsmB [Salinicola endophyticus]WFF42262.1 16S rRNA (cytosine(967)-C(5))-methyltransferase RsmB [Salinicola endophyticus]
MSGVSARVVAARLLVPVINGEGSLASLDAEIAAQGVAERDRGFVKALCFGVCRAYPRLEALSAELLRQPLKRRDSDIQALLLLGLYQLLHMRVPAHAAVSETAGAARGLGKDWATRVLNGCLRRFQRESVALQAKVDRDPPVALWHPAWLLKALRQAWPEAWQALCAANNDAGPMTLRVNRRRVARDAYLERLGAAGIEATACHYAADGIQLAGAVDVHQLPGFAEGDVSVQDESAQLCADLLAPALEGRDGARVFDACAAPGGKSAHLLERFTLDLTASDIDPGRLARVGATLERLGLDARLSALDASSATLAETLGHAPESADTAAPSAGFDAILLDAPCSGTGVIRRHPDIKLTRRASDIGELAALQARLLDNLWRQLAPGGTLLYATCSVLPAENAEQIAAFLARTPDARATTPEALAWGQTAGHGRQLLTAQGGHDGFFYARLEKVAD